MAGQVKVVNRQEIIKLTITLQGKEGAIGIGKNVVRVLGAPQYLTLRISYKNNSLLLQPCDQKDVMSFEIPHNFLSGRHVNYRIRSLSFVRELLDSNGLMNDSTYVLDGLYSSRLNAVAFPLASAKLWTESESSTSKAVQRLEN